MRLLLVAVLLLQVSPTQTLTAWPGGESAAIRLFRLGDYSRASGAFQEEIEKGDAPARWQLYLGVCLINSGRPAAALEPLETFTRLSPDSHEGWFNLAIAYFSLGELDQAEKRLKRSLEGRPDQASAYKLLGRIQVSQSKNRQAEEAFLKAKELDPSDFESRYFLGRLYQSTGRLERAAGEFETALAANPQCVRCLAYLGTVLYGLAKTSTSESRLTEALVLNEKLSTTDFVPYLEYGIFLQRTGRSEQSIEHLRMAMEKGAPGVEAHFELARSLYRLRKLSESQDVLETALLRDAQDPRLHYLLSRVCYEQGNEACGKYHSQMSERSREGF